MVFFLAIEKEKYKLLPVIMAIVAQLVELLTVTQDVAGSSPVDRPII